VSVKTRRCILHFLSWQRQFRVKLTVSNLDASSSLVPMALVHKAGKLKFGHVFIKRAAETKGHEQTAQSYDKQDRGLIFSKLVRQALNIKRHPIYVIKKLGNLSGKSTLWLFLFLTWHAVISGVLVLQI
jgi:hypothetical protein